MQNDFLNFQENYLRDDIFCGSAMCDKCEQETTVLRDEPRITYLVPTYDVLVTQPDWISNPYVENVILLQSVLQRLREEVPFLYHIIREQADNKERHIYVFSDVHHRYFIAFFFLLIYSLNFFFSSTYLFRQCHVEQKENELHANWLERGIYYFIYIKLRIKCEWRKRILSLFCTQNTFSLELMLCLETISAVEWYTGHFKGKSVAIVMLTHDVIKRDAALQHKVIAKTSKIHSFFFSFFETVFYR